MPQEVAMHKKGKAEQVLLVTRVSYAVHQSVHWYFYEADPQSIYTIGVIAGTIEGINPAPLLCSYGMSQYC